MTSTPHDRSVRELALIDDLLADVADRARQLRRIEQMTLAAELAELAADLLRGTDPNGGAA